ncbi:MULTISPECIES: adenylate/guanylate cyclase domain-containing protein [Mumia]|uniref:adenylate/guanylate cyclase domain-containing protein n=1 Tax=Mumia TaxID=1546255 RepID=UPI00141E8619|nr:MULTISPECIES: adenylate/guanylate cyclase domain-containing protein [unclassified Mumia]QMW65596.1 adenylate/guanylate cyclase domain-containing protein [Mumia sp. ZJ1417]
MADDLARAILGAEPTFTSDEIAAAAGLSYEETRRLWRALGFPDSAGTKAFVPADLDALQTVRAIVGTGVIDEDTVVRLTRALGSTMSRLADWQVSTIAEVLERRTGSGELERVAWSTSGRAVAEAMGPVFERLLVYAWRRHLAASASRAEALAADEEDVLRMVVTVGFADLVAFTKLSNGLDDDGLADLVEEFESRCIDIITEGGGRPIKTLGDAVLFVAETPELAADIAFAVVAEIGGDRDLPDVRVGLGTGPVISRLGDVYGPPVNLASRLTAVARRNRVIIDRATADGLSDRFETRAMAQRHLRGFGTMEPLTVRHRWSYNG